MCEHFLELRNVLRCGTFHTLLLDIYFLIWSTSGVLGFAAQCDDCAFVTSTELCSDSVTRVAARREVNITSAAPFLYVAQQEISKELNGRLY